MKPMNKKALGRSASTDGFTIIELLVVVAIIGILASTILASLGSSRIKGNAASVKEHLMSARNAGELFYANNNSSYGTTDTGTAGADCIGAVGTIGTLFNDASSSNIKAIINSVSSVAGVGAANMDCGATAFQWSVAVVLPGGGVWCVDYNGSSRGTYSGGAYTGGTNGLYGAASAAHTTAGATSCN
jgi:prepilin-type N-terminal cleavage/methylation domain-containing protein